MNVILKHKVVGAVMEPIRSHRDYIPAADERFKSPVGKAWFYKVNDYTVLHIKRGSFRGFLGEYTFQYTNPNVAALDYINELGDNVNLWLALYCEDHDKICAVRYRDLLELIDEVGDWKNIIYVQYDRKHQWFYFHVQGPEHRTVLPNVVELKDFPNRLFKS